MIGPFGVLQDVIERLDKIGVDYFLVGSLASMYYSRPRFTNDIDLVVQISASKARLIEEQFPLEDYYCPPIEVIRDEIIRRGSFNLIHQDTGIKVDLLLDKGTDFYLSEFTRRKKVKLSPSFEAYIASAEDVILKKLDFYNEGRSEKHISDIQEILASTDVDLKYLEFWVKKMNLSEAWLKANK